MSDYSETLRELRRSMILRHLERCKDYTSNADILIDVINGTPDGVTAYHSDVVGDLSWLETHGYVILSGDEQVVIAEATMRGLRVARGENVAKGIARPGPRR